MENRKYSIGQKIFSEGDVGEHAFLVKAGEVKITKIAKDDTPRTIATVNACHIIGEMALIDDQPRAASAVVLEPTEVLVISKDEFQKRLDNSDQVINLLMLSFTNRLRQQAQQIVELMA